MSKEVKYKSKAITKSIKLTSRASTKIGNDFYTFEACEERILPPPEVEEVDVEKERQLLWNELNEQVDNQIIKANECV